MGKQTSKTFFLLGTLMKVLPYDNMIKKMLECNCKWYRYLYKLVGLYIQFWMYQWEGTTSVTPMRSRHWDTNVKPKPAVKRATVVKGDIFLLFDWTNQNFSYKLGSVWENIKVEICLWKFLCGMSSRNSIIKHCFWHWRTNFIL